MAGLWTRLTGWLRPPRDEHAAHNADAPAARLPCPVFAQWGAILEPHPQVPKVVEIFMQGDLQVTCFRMTPGEGEWTKFYMFFVGTPGSPCPDMIVSAGSYRFSNQHRPPDSRLYHFDLYDADQHTTIWLKDYLPGYEELRQEVVDMLALKQE